MIIFSFQPLAIIEAVRNRTAGIQHFGALIFQTLYPFIDCFLGWHIIEIAPFQPFSL